MIDDYLSFDNFNHKFKYVENSNFEKDIEFVKCTVCNLKVWIGEDQLWQFVGNLGHWEQLNASCEEMQIKRLLE